MYTLLYGRRSHLSASLSRFGRAYQTATRGIDGIRKALLPAPVTMCHSEIDSSAPSEVRRRTPEIDGYARIIRGTCERALAEAECVLPAAGDRVRVRDQFRVRQAHANAPQREDR
jgi:hypothetical protein